MLAGLTFLLSSPVFAYPEGAPWDAADVNSADSCNSCHFDQEPVRASDSISILFPERIDADGENLLRVIVDADVSAVVGFLLQSEAGTFTGEEGVEVLEGQVRSTHPSRPQEGRVVWHIRWRAPQLSLIHI